MIQTLGYVCIEARDIPAWRAFATGVLGMAPEDGPAGRLQLRMDERHWRILLEPGERDDITVLGWEVATEAGLDECLYRLRKSGVAIGDHTGELAGQRGVQRLLSCQDPGGLRHEISVAPTQASERPFRPELLRGPGFLTGSLGVGHVLLAVEDYEGMLAFCQDALGLRLSDRLRQEMGADFTLNATFLHGGSGRHHSLAVAAVPQPRRLHHLMVEYASLNDLGAALDRAIDAGVTLLSGIGHHPNDQMTSFYMQTPSGFGMELGWGGLVIRDEENWQGILHDRISDWGHRPPGGTAQAH